MPTLIYYLQSSTHQSRCVIYCPHDGAASWAQRLKPQSFIIIISLSIVFSIPRLSPTSPSFTDCKTVCEVKVVHVSVNSVFCTDSGCVLLCFRGSYRRWASQWHNCAVSKHVCLDVPAVSRSSWTPTCIAEMSPSATRSRRRPSDLHRPMGLPSDCRGPARCLLPDTYLPDLVDHIRLLRWIIATAGRRVGISSVYVPGPVSTSLVAM